MELLNSNTIETFGIFYSRPYIITSTVWYHFYVIPVLSLFHEVCISIYDVIFLWLLLAYVMLIYLYAALRIFTLTTVLVYPWLLLILCWLSLMTSWSSLLIEYEREEASLTGRKNEMIH